jgi:predicted amidophosphoribosyltransferase
VDTTELQGEKQTNQAVNVPKAVPAIAVRDAFCNGCGSRLDLEEAFCSQCGRKK